ncbi:MAG: exodeoxyribonuclease III [Burkholderiales bacterium]|jgi:exodeoxyribonuclease-3|nr:exodeoxyribonuclease III [Burkholderiales bacterium]
MKLASWNVNSLKVRLEHVSEWLTLHEPDLLGLQELKLTDDSFPLAHFESMGYGAVFAGQKTYNGVAILYKQASMPKPQDVEINLPSFPDEQRRVIAATFDDLRFVSAYVVNGSEVGSEKFAYKLKWLDALIKDLADWTKKYPDLALVGDFNIAPADADVYDPAAWDEAVLCSPEERSRFKSLIELGYTDAFRQFEQAPSTFSWWDYRQLGFQKNRGLRIDHILLSQSLTPRLTQCEIDRIPRKKKQPSDHAPIWAQLK